MTSLRLPLARGRAALASTSTRTFALWPLVVGVDVLRAGRRIHWPWLGLSVAGYLLYYGAGKYRTRHGGGGPGMSNPPERLVTTGVYAWTRNPMYLGHVLCLTGLATAARSPLSWTLLLSHLPWFDARVRADEARMAQLFGEEFSAYRRRVPRWLGLPSDAAPGRG